LAIIFKLFGNFRDQRIIWIGVGQQWTDGQQYFGDRQCRTVYWIMVGWNERQTKKNNTLDRETTHRESTLELDHCSVSLCTLVRSAAAQNEKVLNHLPPLILQYI
jgi:hypothetical protein